MLPGGFLALKLTDEFTPYQAAPVAIAFRSVRKMRTFCVQKACFLRTPECTTDNVEIIGSLATWLL